MRRISEDTVDTAQHAQANMMIHGYMAHSAVFIEQTWLMFLCIKIYHSNDLPGVWPRRYVIVRGTMWTLIHVRTGRFGRSCEILQGHITISIANKQ